MPTGYGEDLPWSSESGAAKVSLRSFPIDSVVVAVYEQGKLIGRRIGEIGKGKQWEFGSAIFRWMS
jgi:hypothetical protein